MTFRGDNRAQSTLIGFILLFGILVLAFAGYQAFIVPDQNAEVEFNHNDEVQTDMQDVRNSLLDVRSVERVDDGEYEIVSEHRPRRVKLGTQYPARLIALNPPPASGTLQTTEPETGVQIENAQVKNPDNFNPDANLDALFDEHETRFLTYRPNYSEYQDPPNTVLEHSLLYNEFSEADLVVREQNVVNTSRNRINIVLFAGDFSRSNSGAITLDPQTLDGPTAPVPIEADGGDITLRIPTDSPEVWEEQIDSLSGAEINEDESSDEEIVIELQDDEYTLRMSKVGFDGGANEEQFTPIQYEIDPAEGAGGDETLPGPEVFDAEGPNEGDEPLENGDTFTLTATVSNVGAINDQRGGTAIQDAEWYIEGDDPGEGNANSMTASSGSYLSSIEIETEDEVGANQLEDGENTLVIRGQDSRGIWGEDTDSVTVEVDRSETMADRIEYVEGSGEDTNNNGRVQFELENTGNESSEITGLTVDGTTDNNADRVDNDENREFDGAGGYINLDGSIDIGDGTVTDLDEEAIIDGGNIERLDLEQFRRANGNSVNLNNDDITVTVYFDDGSNLQFTAESL